MKIIAQASLLPTPQVLANRNCSSGAGPQRVNVVFPDLSVLLTTVVEIVEDLPVLEN